VKGSLSIEAVSLTLGIWNLSTRHNWRAWRNLGYVKNQKVWRAKGSDPALKKLRDMHNMMWLIFEDGGLKNAQDSGGIAWRLSVKGGWKDVILKIPLLHVIGDTQGHDKFCGKYGTYTKGVRRYCRYCSTPSSKNTDGFYEGWQHTLPQEVDAIICSGDSSAMKEISVHDLPMNAFRLLDYGGCERGINGATPAEPLHVIQQGLTPVFLEFVFCMKSTSKEKIKEDMKETTDNAEVNQPRGEKDKGHRLVISDGDKKVIDDLARMISKYLDYAKDALGGQRVTFPKGFFAMDFLPGHERQGLLLVLTALLSSQYHCRKITGKTGNKYVSDLVRCMEDILLLDNYMRSTKVSIEDNEQVRWYIPYFINKFFHCVVDVGGKKKKDGMLKPHLLLHHCDDVKRHGAGQNFNSGPCESIHKFVSKMPAQNTQRRFQSFEEQTANQFVERLAAAMDLEAKKGVVVKENETARNVYPDFIVTRGKEFYIYKIVSEAARRAFTVKEHNPSCYENIDDWLGKRCGTAKTPHLVGIRAESTIGARIESFVVNDILPRLHETPYVVLYQRARLPTEVGEQRFGRKLINIHYKPLDTEKEDKKSEGSNEDEAPPFQSLADRAIRPWVLVNWVVNPTDYLEREETIPSHLVIFIHIRGVVSPFQINGCSVTADGLYCVGETLEQGLDGTPWRHQDYVGNTFCQEQEFHLFRWCQKWVLRDRYIHPSDEFDLRPKKEKGKPTKKLTEAQKN